MSDMVIEFPPPCDGQCLWRLFGYQPLWIEGDGWIATRAYLGDFDTENNYLGRYIGAFE